MFLRRICGMAVPGMVCRASFFWPRPCGTIQTFWASAIALFARVCGETGNRGACVSFALSISPRVMTVA